MTASAMASRQALTLLSVYRPAANACVAHRRLAFAPRTHKQPAVLVPHRRCISTSRSVSSAGAGKFSFHIAASFIGKDRPYDPNVHIFHFNPYNRIQQTRRNKRSRPDSGQDAFFVSRVGDTGSVALGVADGVGGWVDSGVDPADFSHGFCEYMAASAYEYNSNKPDRTPTRNAARELLTARSLMQKGYQAICEDKSVAAGGSTACVAVASPEGSLDVANLGDSGFLQIRLNGVYAYSEPQTHAFNTPFQLSVVPPSVAARMAAFGGAQLSDFPRDADVTRHELRHGDILVFASDGLWDNLFNQDILRIASRVMTSAGAWVMTDEGSIRVVDNLKPFTKQSDDGMKGTHQFQATLQSVLATEITGAARAASVNRKLDGPFAKEVQKYYPQENWRGGKVDDICVVVMVVSDDSRAELKSRL